MEKTNKEYDYIIAGSGCAGLSLLYNLLQDPVLSSRQILVLDKEAKNKDDRTWCFWENGQGQFEEIVKHRWNTLEFISTDFKRTFDMERYAYKMIKGIDFYAFVMNFAADFENVSFLNEGITEIKSEGNSVRVRTSENLYKAKYAFNSTGLFNPEINPDNSLLQHFKGWTIRTNTPTFDRSVGTLMDFSLDQKHGTTFMYVLPNSATEALIEYTLFTKEVLPMSEYEEALRRYIKSDLLIADYEITHEEFGVIPMSLAKFPRSSADGRIVHIGTAGGYTKASTGYTFQFIQKATKSIISRLKEDLSPLEKLTYREKMYQWYDRTVLDVLITEKMTGKEIFSTMFKKLPPEKILAFLGNESSFLDELRIMNSVPKLPFMRAGLKVLGE